MAGRRDRLDRRIHGAADASIVTVALPRIGRAFSVGPGVAVWVALSYLLVLICTLPMAGHLADRFGRKRLYVQGFAVFALASAACGLAPDLPALVLARVVQGAGAALLQANSVALIRETLEPRELGRGIGIQGAAQALGLALGPAAGGLLLAAGGWRLLFLVNVPAGAAGVLAGVLLLPRSTTLLRGRHLDVVGALLLPLGDRPAACRSLARAPLGGGCGDRGRRRRPRRRPRPLRGGAARELAAPGPFAPAPPPVPDRAGERSASRRRRSSGRWSRCRSRSPHAASARLPSASSAALPIALGICAPFAGRLGARASAAGLAVAGAALIGLALADTTVARLAMLALAGAGLGVFVPANNALVMRAAPAGRVAEIGGVLNMTRALGTALGVALASLLYGVAPDWRLQSARSPRRRRQPSSHAHERQEVRACASKQIVVRLR